MAAVVQGAEHDARKVDRLNVHAEQGALHAKKVPSTQEIIFSISLINFISIILSPCNHIYHQIIIKVL